MRIGLIAPPWIPVPPPAYGGTEVVVDNLARGLQALGHEIRLFTVGGSTCPVPRRQLYPAPVQPLGAAVPEAVHVLAAYEALADMDLVHDHTDLGPLLADRRGVRHPPIVVTNHGPFTPETRRLYAAVARHAQIVAISRSQARQAGGLPIAAVIHHGVDLDVYREGPGDGGYLLFIGRMSPDKGAHRALRVAREAGWPLEIVTKMRESDERAYFEREVRGLLPPGAGVPGERPLDERLRLLRGARALLDPITWAEPFGLVMAEALASGTPVLAFPQGAAPEIVQHGTTGFLCDDETAMVAAVGDVARIRRPDCRAAAVRHFSLERMARDHERLYRRVLEGPRVGVPRRRIIAARPARRLGAAGG